METKKIQRGHPKVAQPAIQQGGYLAKNLKRHFTKKEMASIYILTQEFWLPLVEIGRGRFFAPFIYIFGHSVALVDFRNKVVSFLNQTYNYIDYDKAAHFSAF